MTASSCSGGMMGRERVDWKVFGGGTPEWEKTRREGVTFEVEGDVLLIGGCARLRVRLC